MSDTLRLDLASLNGLYVDLMRVSIGFAEIESFDEDLRDAVGHDGLADRVHDFGAGWDDRRKKIIASMDTIWHAVQVVESTFVDVDGQLAQVLTPEGSAS